MNVESNVDREPGFEAQDDLNPVLVLKEVSQL